VLKALQFRNPCIELLVFGIELHEPGIDGEISAAVLRDDTFRLADTGQGHVGQFPSVSRQLTGQLSEAHQRRALVGRCQCVKYAYRLR
jgi:hypothetical protein